MLQCFSQALFVFFLKLNTAYQYQQHEDKTHLHPPSGAAPAQPIRRWIAAPASGGAPPTSAASEGDGEQQLLPATAAASATSSRCRRSAGGLGRWQATSSATMAKRELAPFWSRPHDRRIQPRWVIVRSLSLSLSEEFLYLISYNRSLICCVYYFLHCLLIRFLFRLIWATGCPRWKSSLHRPASRTRLIGRYLVVEGMHFIYGWCLCLPVLLFWLVNWLHKCTCSFSFLLHIQHLLLCILPKCTP